MCTPAWDGPGGSRKLLAAGPALRLEEGPWSPEGTGRVAEVLTWCSRGGGGGARGPCQFPQKCLIFESAAFVFLQGGGSWRECVPELRSMPGFPPSRRPRARKSDTEKGKGNRHPVWSDCLVFFQK